MPIFVKILTKAIRQSNENFATAIQQMSSSILQAAEHMYESWQYNLTF